MIPPDLVTQTFQANLSNHTESSQGTNRDQHYYFDGYSNFRVRSLPHSAAISSDNCICGPLGPASLVPRYQQSDNSNENNPSRQRQVTTYRQMTGTTGYNGQSGTRTAAFVAPSCPIEWSNPSENLANNSATNDRPSLVVSCVFFACLR
jgi:hypothetical protein